MFDRRFRLAVAFLFAALAAGVFWLDRQFEAPDAKFVPSLAGELAASSVLAIFAHPDDEQLVTGLLIRANARDGARVGMITFTKGEAGTQMPRIARQEDLGVVRHAELLKSGFALGLDQQRVWDYPDGGVPDTDFEERVSRVEALLAEWRPDLVVTFWPDSGFSNHPDHMEVGRTASEAVRRRVQEDPATAPKAIAYALAPSRMMRRFGGERGRLVVANQPPATHAMPGEPEAKIRGWRIHASQGQYVQRTYGMPPWLLHRLYDKEHYFVRFSSDL
ncbi:MAG: hypothetical protein GC152_11675 [Alphaproteobacteria bacterium]|nr:hypothetical protein [Alphaproteobacteria bacterium]